MFGKAEAAGISRVKDQRTGSYENTEKESQGVCTVVCLRLFHILMGV